MWAQGILGRVGFIRKIRLVAVGCVLPFLLSSCTYLKYTSIQAEYARLQNADPSQVNLKHMLDREKFFVFGRTLDDAGVYAKSSMAISAYSSKFKDNERVSTMFFVGSGTHYGLNLPEGDYTLVVYSDNNNDQVFQRSEIVGQKDIELKATETVEKVVGSIDIKLEDARVIDWVETIPVPGMTQNKQSLFYPSGSIRNLDDPIFDEEVSVLGMYDPASFMEYAPTMFYALEEDLGYKTPVVFVHGIGSGPRSFEEIIKHLDLTRYKPWFFYYPSGGDLDQLADLFYQLYLSGEVIPLQGMPMIVVAHSMGGVVVREALNNYEGDEEENKVKLFVSIASPLGGHPSAALGEKNGPIVLPAWRDLNPNNTFIKELYRKPLPEFLSHQLFYAYNNSRALKIGQNSDGVVPLFSQLNPDAQRQSDGQFGFNSDHVGILKNQEMIDLLLDKMDQVETIYSKEQMALLLEGGFDIELPDDYSPIVQYLIHSVGKYLVALAQEKVEPISSGQKHFVQAVKGEAFSPRPLEKEFIRFMQEYPEVIKNAP